MIQQNVQPPQNGTIGYDEDMGYRTMTREDAAMIQQISTPGIVHTPITQQPPNSQSIPQSPPNSQGHHRTSRYINLCRRFFCYTTFLSCLVYV